MSTKPIIIERLDKRVKKVCANPNFKMKCINCGDEFLSSRSTALFCSDFCQRTYRSKKPKETMKKVHLFLNNKLGKDRGEKMYEKILENFSHLKLSEDSEIPQPIKKVMKDSYPDFL